METASPSLSSAMVWMTAQMAVMRHSVHQSRNIVGSVIFSNSNLFPDVVEMMTGSGVTTVTASPSSGCVTGRMTAWTGVMRRIARLRKLLILSH